MSHAFRVVFCLLAALALTGGAPPAADMPAVDVAAERSIDPEFARLLSVLIPRTNVPLWLPIEAPRHVEGGGSCPNHYNFMTYDAADRSESQVTPDGFEIRLLCLPYSVPPDDDRFWEL